jgi:iron complex transport system substrate-binding protein
MTVVAASVVVGATQVGATPAATPAPIPRSPAQHVMSLNLCTDQLLLDLVAPQRIVSLTFLARSPSDAVHWREATKIPVNHGYAEEVLAAKPDLVLTGTYTTAGTREMLKQLGVPLVEVPPASNFQEIHAVTRQVAQALGESVAGERLLSIMDSTLGELEEERSDRIITVAGWNGSGSVPGKGTLFDAILSAAGGINIAASMQGTRSGSFDIEELLMAQPDVLAYGAGNRAPALRDDSDQHPLILKLYGHRRVAYPEALYSCGIPEAAEAAVALRATLLAAMNSRAP